MPLNTHTKTFSFTKYENNIEKFSISYWSQGLPVAPVCLLLLARISAELGERSEKNVDHKFACKNR